MLPYSSVTLPWVCVCLCILCMISVWIVLTLAFRHLLLHICCFRHWFFFAYTFVAKKTEAEAELYNFYLNSYAFCICCATQRRICLPVSCLPCGYVANMAWKAACHLLLATCNKLQLVHIKCKCISSFSSLQTHTHTQRSFYFLYLILCLLLFALLLFCCTFWWQAEVLPRSLSSNAVHLL